MTRRRFLTTSALAAVASTGAASLVLGAGERVRLTRHTLAWPGRTTIRLAHLTDIHVGWATPERLIDQACDHCCRVRPDLVVLTGDYVNHSVKHSPALGEMLARLPRPCVATLGNHDHWSGAEEVQRVLQDQGIVVLRNSHTTLTVRGEKITLVGVDDAHTRHHDIEQSFAGVADSGTAIVLTHHPRIIAEIAARSPRLVLAGHTHGGFWDVPRVTPAVFRAVGMPYVAGWYEVGTTPLYVNAGIGASVVRRRIGPAAVPEVAAFDLG